MSTITVTELKNLFTQQNTVIYTTLETLLSTDILTDSAKTEIIRAAAESEVLNEFYQVLKSQIENHRNKEIEVTKLLNIYNQFKYNLTVRTKQAITQIGITNQSHIIEVSNASMLGIKAFRDIVQTYLQNKTS